MRIVPAAMAVIDKSIVNAKGWSLLSGKRNWRHFAALVLIAVGVLSGGYLLFGQWLQPDQSSTVIADVSPIPQAQATHRINADSKSVKHPSRQPQEYANLRILVPQQLSKTEQSLILQYASQHQLRPVWIGVDDPAQLAPLLQSGKADMIVSARPSLLERAQDQFLFTLPWGMSRQQVVVRADTGRLKDAKDLSTRQVAIKRSSPMWEKLTQLANRYPGMDLLVIPEQADVETVLQRVASARYDVTIMDSVILESHLPQYIELDIAFNFTEEEVMSWVVMPDAQALHDSLNKFLNKKHLEINLAKRYREDLPALQTKGLLRLITYQNSVSYFLDKGKLKGFEYELAARFAKINNMRLDVVIANSHEQMRTLLLQGKGDVIAAAIHVGSYVDDKGISYSKAYNYSAPIIVGRTYDTPLIDIRDLEGRRITLPAESPYREVLQQIRKQGVDFKIVDTEPGLDMEETLFRVSQGMYDLTVIGGHQINAEFIRQLDLKSHFSLTEPLPLTWVVRQGDSQLLSALNEYITTQFRKSFYNLLAVKYIEKPLLHKADSGLLANIDRLSPYDEIVHKYAEKYGFDWRLIVAQMYQESQFDPEAISDAGAEGLMQLIPATADLLGISDLNDPDVSIHGGIRYLDYLRGRFEQDLRLEDRTWFSLAAYNAGYNRVKRGRALAAKMGLDKDQWFNNVEKAMLELSKPYYKDGVRIRYCRCGQTAYYVREIKTLYSNYVRLTQSVRLASSESLLGHGS